MLCCIHIASVRSASSRDFTMPRMMPAKRSLRPSGPGIAKRGRPGVVAQMTISRSRNSRAAARAEVYAATGWAPAATQAAE
ncbi:MAG: hypothetical protein AB7O56_04570 [Bauldia sp.]